MMRILCCLIFILVESSLWAIKWQEMRSIAPGFYSKEYINYLGPGRLQRGMNWYRFDLPCSAEVLIELFFNPKAGNIEAYLYKEGVKIFLDRARYDDRWPYSPIDSKAQETIIRPLVPGRYFILVQEVDRKSNFFDLKFKVTPLAGGVLPEPSAPAVTVPPTVQYVAGSLVEAMESKDEAKVRKLIIEGAPLEELTKVGGNTVLHLAVRQKKVKLVNWLLEQGAQIDAVSKNGSTPLHYAVEKSHLEMVALLLQAGAKVHLRNHLGETALEMAHRRELGDIVALLQDVRAEKGDLDKLAAKRRQELLDLGLNADEIKQMLKEEGFI